MIDATTMAATQSAVKWAAFLLRAIYFPSFCRSRLIANSRRSLYRRALQQSLSWTVRRDLWRVQAMNIRDLFEANKDVTEPRQLSVAFALLQPVDVMHI